MIKRELRSRGNQLGQSTEARVARVKALSQIINAKLSKNDVFSEILTKIRQACLAGHDI